MDNKDKLKKVKLRKWKGRVINMATQIAPTPIIYGEEARKIMREAKTVQSEKSKENAKRIIEFFNKFIQKED